MTKSHVIFAGIALVLLGGCSRHEGKESAEQSTAEVGAEKGKVMSAMADLRPTQGNQAKGHLMLVPEKGGVRIRGTISGLKGGSKHGFHVHEKGDCASPDAKSAGDHFNPGHAQHGKAKSGEHHLGDMDNLSANGQGDAQVDVLIAGATLGDGSSNDVVGKAFIVHASEDDYKSQPAGDSGPRIACGVISKQ
jgi:Cu-Zn family superoxide dismutase